MGKKRSRFEDHNKKSTEESKSSSEVNKSRDINKSRSGCDDKGRDTDKNRPVCDEKSRDTDKNRSGCGDKSRDTDNGDLAVRRSYSGDRSGKRRSPVSRASSRQSPGNSRPSTGGSRPSSGGSRPLSGGSRPPSGSSRPSSAGRDSIGTATSSTKDVADSLPTKTPISLPSLPVVFVNSVGGSGAPRALVIPKADLGDF